ncbi:hypothetical protein [Serratia marcescens]|uniref:hypothetical protein n=1 Tax=Serratia marcescens TaxID=615 RepID=UPI000EF1355D|nr:hypothetical protein [Serratia marcescens]RLO44602.1 hypothetical protein CLM68_11305 [Serratia marcescens]RLO51462.1 hypothetical protein CLM67_03580 [Serratia marcescens]WAZ01781.1 hypothetical protein O3T14_03115 [Serratia marcescens]HBC0643591.1 hypothetical protein [Serratia marcescens]
MKNIVENQGIKTDKPLAMSYEALKAERDAQQKRADALAVENSALSAALSLISGSYGLSPHIQSMCAVDTPTTDAALAAIQAQGVEKFADMCREKSKLATTADSCAGWKNCSVHASSFAIRLREAK